MSRPPVLPASAHVVSRIVPVARSLVSSDEGEGTGRRVPKTWGYLEVSLVRLKAKNALSEAMYLQLAALLDAAASDPSIGAVLLTGRGQYFSSGTDLTDGADTIQPGVLPNAILGGATVRFMQAMLRFPKPVVAAVNGPAVGIGVTLLLHCDMVISSESAWFWVPFQRVGIVPEFGSSSLLEDALGRSLASELMLAQVPVSAARLRDAGLISRTTPDARTALRVCRRLLSAMLSSPAAHETVPLFRAAMARGRERRLGASAAETTMAELGELGARASSGRTATVATAGVLRAAIDGGAARIRAHL